MTVTSQVSGLPPRQGMRVNPSGRLPSSLRSPTGSLVHGTPAEAKALAIVSFKAWWRRILPGALLHTNPWIPLTSAGAPHRHSWGTLTLDPNRRETATRIASSSKRRPHVARGKADSHYYTHT